MRGHVSLLLNTFWNLNLLDLEDTLNVPHALRCRGFLNSAIVDELVWILKRILKDTKDTMTGCVPESENSHVALDKTANRIRSKSLVLHRLCLAKLLMQREFMYV
jgi:hypothetical protein